MKTVYEEYQFGAWRKCLKTAPLRASGGIYGGGTENIVTEDIKAVDAKNFVEGNVNGTLTSAAGHNTESNNLVRVYTGDRGEKDGTTKGAETLCILWKAYGKEKVSEWCSSVLESLQQAKVLQPGVHEEIVQGKTSQGNELDDGSLPRKEYITDRLLRDMWEQQKCGCSPQGWESTEQQQGQSDEGLPELSQQNPQTAQNLCNLWRKGKGLRLLREALSAFQKIRQPIRSEKREVRYAVRRLTPIEAERLQGLPDNFTLIDDKTCSDSARYKALGNGMASPCAEFVIRRIVEEVGEE